MPFYVAATPSKRVRHQLPVRHDRGRDVGIDAVRRFHVERNHPSPIMRSECLMTSRFIDRLGDDEASIRWKFALVVCATLSMERDAPQFGPHRPAVFGYCYRMLGSVFDANAAVEEHHDADVEIL